MFEARSTLSRPQSGATPAGRKERTGEVSMESRFRPRSWFVGSWSAGRVGTQEIFLTGGKEVRRTSFLGAHGALARAAEGAERKVSAGSRIDSKDAVRSRWQAFFNTVELDFRELQQEPVRGY